MKPKKPNLSQDLVRSLLSYDPQTGLLTWIKQRGGRAAPGKIAGTKRPDGYIIITLKNKTYLAHRLAWLHFYGEWPLDQIDHINTDKTDNRVANLRRCNHAGNQRNRGTRRSNTSGMKGVHFFKRDQRWQASICVNHKAIHLGYFDTKEDAAAAYNAAALEHFGEFACLNEMAPVTS